MTSPTSPTERPPRFFSVGETAAIFKVSEVTIYREIAAGKIPAVQMRGRYVIPAKAIDQIEADALARCNSQPETSPDGDWNVA